MKLTSRMPESRVAVMQRLAVAAVAIALTVASVRASRDALPVDAVLSDAGWADAGWADESTCQECHVEADTYPATGHAQTLRPASAPRSIELLKSFNHDKNEAHDGMQIEIQSDGVPLVVQDKDGITRRIKLDWCFGSGAHAHTWSSMINDRVGISDELEVRWTWFHQGEQFDTTPGQDNDASATHFGNFGLFFDGPKAVRCFSCHSSHIPADQNAIHFDQVVAGINCQRCHGPHQSHVESDGEVLVDAWRPKNRLDAVQRCGQCHRNADEQAPEDIRPDNRDIVRFQPVGLLQSACFKQSQMTCTTCHDPHLPLEAQDSRGIWQCVQCHDSGQPQHTTCAAAETTDCLRCHMPALSMDSPVRFTDHWIRVRDDIQAATQ